MSHRVGALLMPAPPPPFGPVAPGDVTPVIDPALETLGAFFRAMIEHYCGDAWASIAPGEPIVRKLSIGHDPEEFDFQDGDTPLLALWRESEGTPHRLTDGNAQGTSTVHVLWVMAPADEQKLAARSPFFNLVNKAMLLALANERDPCWIKAGRESNPVDRTYGSYVWGYAGIDGWDYAGLRRVPIKVPIGGQHQDFASYLATWTIRESTDNDPAAFGSTIGGVRVGTEPTSIRFDLTDRAPVDENDTGVLVRQSADIDFPPDT
jgi:hypothetical protein